MHRSLYLLFALALVLFTLIPASAKYLNADIRQHIRGVVLNQDSHAPLPGAVIVVVTAPALGTTSGVDGSFYLGDVPLGRQTLRVSLIGFKARFISNLDLTAGKEIVLTVGLEEEVYTLTEATVAYQRDKASTNNEMTTVSARSFNIEETSRFAGSRNDPARMATNFAGVSGANDARNDIIIRGNSPAGLLWRLDGINIPNPNHFGALGASGGPVSLLNYNVLDKSDFLTSAFPAQYGNAVGGVFDLQLRNGNNQKHEYLGQVGFNGFELGAEGPFTSAHKGSFLINYRYSTLGVFQALGLNFGTGSGTPKYQDINFKFNFPTQKGRFTIFGLGGLSSLNLLGSKDDTTQANYYGSSGRDTYFRYQTGVLGASYQHQISTNTYATISLAASHTGESFINDSVSAVNRQITPLETSDFLVNKYSLHALLNRRWSARNSMVFGTVVDVYDFSLDRVRLLSGGSPTRARNTRGAPALAQVYGQWQHRFTNALTLNAGVNTAYSSIGGHQTIEPRVGVKYQLDPRQTISAGFGLHSQMQPLPVYYTETRGANGAVARTNQQLDLVRSQHYVLGYDRMFGPDWHLRAEVYYQYLYRAGVERYASSFSLLNTGGDFLFPDNDNLVSRGKGRNYGIELTAEKFFNKGYYVLTTVSLFDSKYAGSDGVWRNTSFNGKYVLNALAGVELKVGRKTNVFNIDWKLTTAGGRYVTPIDEQASRATGREVLRNDLAFSRQLPSYFRTDLKLSYRVNMTHLTQEFSFDLQNLFNTYNVFSEKYNPATGRYTTEYQIGFFPIPQYRLFF